MAKAALTLETAAAMPGRLCRVGIIDRFTMIPPSEMAGALTRVIATAPWFWPDVTYTLGNLAAAIG